MGVTCHPADGFSPPTHSLKPIADGRARELIDRGTQPQGTHMNDHLVLVANHSQARLLRLEGGDRLVPLETFINHHQEHDSRTDSPGLPTTASRDDDFARHLGSVLEARHAAGLFKGLMLIAPPPFLDTLSSRLCRKLQREVVAKIDKDYTTNTEERILAVLPHVRRRRSAAEIRSPTHR